MIQRIFHFFILVAVMILIGKAPNAFAFSFGGIEINSKFGERFDAEIDVILEEEGDLQIQIGNANDYKRLEMDRPLIIDDLMIEPPAETEGRKRSFRVISKRPLFFPSFHLIVRGTFKGGVLLEPYLITVDFRQSLALNVKGKERQDTEDSLPPVIKKADLLDGGEAIDETPTSQTGENAYDGSDGDSESGSPDAPKKSGFSKNSRVNAPSWMAKPPARIKGNRGEDSYFPGATWVSPTVSIPRMPPMEPSEHQPEKENETALKIGEQTPKDSQVVSETKESVPPEQNPQEESLTTGMSYGPLAKGENLLSIAGKLKTSSDNAARVAAALWMDNPEAFLHGNMNGLKVGSQINLENLEKRLEEIDSALAEKILHSQYQEWKIIKKKFSSTESGVLDMATQEVPLPMESDEEKKMIFDMLQTWKTSWEQGDLDQHLALLSNQNNNSISDAANLRFLKKRMFARHKNIKLRIKQASLVLKGGQPVVSFGQSFSSGTMESYGRKDVGVVWEQGAWKILKEKFKVNEYLEKPEASPDVSEASNEEIFSKERNLDVAYIIHASSHLDYKMATQAVNELRKLGFNAYSSPVNISRKRKIYRVYVGRFASLDLAQELVSELRKHAISKLAIPVKKPYAFLMGEYDQENEAESLMLNLRSLGLSPLLFTVSEKEFLNPKFRVLVGAFTTKKDAARLSNELKARQLTYKLVTP